MIATLYSSSRGGRILPVAGTLMGALTIVLMLPCGLWSKEEFSLRLRRAYELGEKSGRWSYVERSQVWPARATAVIVCDMWDLHHCLNATRRVAEMAPRTDAFLREARDRGALIIHAPSSCMESYADHPARRKAVSLPQASKLPPNIGSWCHWIDSENRDAYPIDQSDGGEDDDLVEHQQWARQLASLGRNPSEPWKTQIGSIAIEDSDYISDDGKEIWSILERHGIQHVMLVGVHTNMCVLGRPFGLRQMTKNGKEVVLVRDLTDTMYNPAMPPYVSHFTGTDYIIEYIERYVCPTIGSEQVLGGKPFRFRADTRPRLAIVISEPEYDTATSLPKFAREHLGKYFSVSILHASPSDGSEIPNLRALDEADVALISIRRRLLPHEDLAVFRRFVQQGKPIVGIRTSSHAFVTREGDVPPSRAAWPEFDFEVWGGHYTGHLGNGRGVQAMVLPGAASPLLLGVRVDRLQSHGSLYNVRPLRDSTAVVLTGTVPGHDPEPVAWTHVTRYGGRAFYTSFGHRDDFENAEFCRLLVNGLCWAAGKELPAAHD